MDKLKRTPEEKERANKIYDDLASEIFKRELSNTESYDRAILTLSSAALGFSLLATRFIIDIEHASNLWMVKAGWVLLVISVAMSLLGFFVSNLALNEHLKNAEDYYVEGIKEAFNRETEFGPINGFMNKLSGLLFIVAVSLIVFFVSSNLG